MQNSGWLNFCARESRGKTCFHYAERSQKCIYEGLKHFFEGRNCVYIARLARVFGLDVSMLPIENPMSPIDFSIPATENSIPPIEIPIPPTEIPIPPTESAISCPAAPAHSTRPPPPPRNLTFAKIPDETAHFCTFGPLGRTAVKKYFSAKWGNVGNNLYFCRL